MSSQFPCGFWQDFPGITWITQKKRINPEELMRFLNHTFNNVQIVNGGE